MAKKNTKKEADRGEQAAAKAATMFAATSLASEEVSGNVSAFNVPDIEAMKKEEELEAAHDALEEEIDRLNLETTPIYESSDSELIKKLTRDLEEANDRYAVLLDEKDTLSKQVETLTNASSKDKKLELAYNELNDKYNVLFEKYSREVEDLKIQLEDARKNFEMYEENESNYKFEISKLKAEIANLEKALSEKPEAQKRLENNLRGTGNTLQSRMNTPEYIRSINEQRKNIRQATRQNPNNGYTSWN